MNDKLCPNSFCQKLSFPMLPIMMHIWIQATKKKTHDIYIYMWKHEKLRFC